MDIHLEAWAEWNEWITVAIYALPQDAAALDKREAEVQAEGYKTRRRNYAAEALARTLAHNPLMYI